MYANQASTTGEEADLVPAKGPPNSLHVSNRRMTNMEDYYPWFDLLRVVLAVVVLLAHDGVITWRNAGNLSVRIFFALSGWLIGGILLATPRAGLPRFYFNRATRIWIPYALALALLISVSLFRDSVTSTYLEIVFYKITFVYNLFGPPMLGTAAALHMPLHGTGNHFWSICAEEQFYLLSPLILVVAPHRVGRSIVLWAAIACFAVSTDTYGAITLGVLASVLRQKFGDWHLAPMWRMVTFGLVLISGGALIFGMFSYAIVSPFFAIAVVWLLAVRGRKTRIGGFWGGVSYPFYLNHWVGVFAAHAVLSPYGLRNSAAAKIVALLINFAFCALLYILVDQQVLRRRGAWYSRRLGILLGATGFSSVVLGLIVGICLRGL